MNNKTVLITGATGFLGFRTTERLERDADVRKIIAAGRILKKGAIVNSGKVKYRLGDLSDKKYVESLFQEGLTHIVHCAALSSPWGKYREFYEANVLSIINLVRETEAHPIERFVHISTPSIYFNHRDRWNIKENDPLPRTFVNHYASTKREAELVLEKSELPYVSLRPRALMGRGDTVIMPRLIRASKEGKLRIMGNGKNIVDLTSVANMTSAIRLAMDVKEKALRQHYNITNGHPVEIWEVIRSTTERLGLAFPEKKIPLVIAKTGAWMIEKYAQLFQTKEPVLTRYSVGALALNFTMDISKARALLSYEPAVTTQSAIEEFIQWFKENGYGDT